MATGLQAAQLGLVRILEAWRDEQLSAREYTTLLDLQARWIERELKRLGLISGRGPGHRTGRALRGNRTAPVSQTGAMARISLKVLESAGRERG